MMDATIYKENPAKSSTSELEHILQEGFFDEKPNDTNNQP
jgi:hypothetical protein